MNIPKAIEQLRQVRASVDADIDDAIAPLSRVAEMFVSELPDTNSQPHAARRGRPPRAAWPRTHTRNNNQGAGRHRRPGT